MEKLISVIMPVYNKAPHIERAIASVLAQDYSSLELVIVDDGSTDGSLDKIRAFSDKRIKIFERNIPGPGGYKARNMGIDNASGDWIAFLDADDKWDKSYLQIVSKTIDEAPTAEVISTRWFWIDENSVIEKKNGLDYFDNRFQPFRLEEFLRNQDLMWTGAITVRKSLIRTVGGFPELPACKKGGDMDTWIRLLQQSKLNLNISVPLAYYYRDTVNRVTSSENNPTTYFCSYDTLLRIYDDTKNINLKSAIRFFVNKNIYNILANHLNSSHDIDRELWSKMFFDVTAVKFSFKLAVRFVLIKLRLL